MDKFFTDNKDKIEEWFGQYNYKPFFYNSVDIRNSGEKIAAVDTNLFPGGFNNISDCNFKLGVDAAKEYFLNYYPNVNNILLIAEDHTRNLFYLENIAVIKEILQHIGKNVKITSFDVSKQNKPATLLSQSGKTIELQPACKKEEDIYVDNLKLDLVIVNNDLTTGAPDLIKNINQDVIPPIDFGWHNRRKTSHFEAYNNLAKKFANYFDIDPWRISTIFHHCGLIDFKQKKGIDCVARGVEKTLHLINLKYQEYGIKREPYVFIKSNNGTYGMGVMIVKSAEEVYEMNKKIRNQMNKIKQGIENSEVIIQEGVITNKLIDNRAAENMVYMMGGKVIGNIYRVNEKKDNQSNLNSQGMYFKNTHEKDYAAEVIARLSGLAASWECYFENYQI